jgi:hypothetical protein
MSSVAEYFNDPLNPERSLQLNNRYWMDDSYEHLDILREAEDDVVHGRFKALRRSLKPVKALLPASVHRPFIRRLVYSIVYHVTFAPMRFTVKLSDELIEANTYRGTADEASLEAKHTEELRYIAGLAHDLYRGHYGLDILSSTFAVRYMSSRNAEARRRMTEFGDLSDFHLDEGKDFTCIIYLCPVTRDNGCFSYVEGSTAMPKSHILRALHQVVEFDLKLATPDARAHLPLELRGSMAIGNYLDEEKHARVRDACVEVVGNPGEGIVFNGFDTLHRGGKPLSGDRTAMFISTRGHVNLRLKKALYDQLAYLWL